MRILGLTGSIAMGKSTAARMLRAMRVPVHDADAAVHALIGPRGMAVPLVEAAFPGTRDGDWINRRVLGARVFTDPEALRRLEGILHPLVRRAESRFLRRHRLARRPVVVLDIPLLFETGGRRRCDTVIVVSAPRLVQRQRVLARPGMTEDRLRAILARQTPDSEKRRRADHVVPSGLGHAVTWRALTRVVRRNRQGGVRTDARGGAGHRDHGS